ncbi:YqiA/YcfP family alpha/beta fold hydrolase [Microbulbifer taiwanensis]|uniref:YqiA/YcfP family alpha/beta fold hydrolase n=1 Tax=Microbulbifer taiwanensis TaxID=986746 RepID=UPI003619DFA9
MSQAEQQNRPLLIYLHGFLSSPQSFKCQLMRERLVADHPRIVFCAPQVSPIRRSPDSLSLPWWRISSRAGAAAP